MSILIAIFLSFTNSYATKATRDTAPTYPLHCKMKAVAGPIEARMDTTGKFSFVVNYQGREFTCSLDPLEITQTKDEPLVPGGKPEGKFKTGIAFSTQVLCDPKDIPDSFTKNLNQDMEWVLREKSLEFFVEAGEPAAPCKIIKYDKKATRMILEMVKKKLPPLDKD